MTQHHTTPIDLPRVQFPVVAPTNTMSILSLVFSLLGTVVFPMLGAVLGLIFGYVARAQIRESSYTQSGDGMAQAGIIIGWIVVAWWAFGIFVATLMLAMGVVGVGMPVCSMCAYFMDYLASQ